MEPALEGGDRHGDPDEWRGRLVAMYRAWAAQRNMQLSEVSTKAKEPPLLLIGGFGPIARSRAKPGCMFWRRRGRRKPSAASRRASGSRLRLWARSRRTSFPQPLPPLFPRAALSNILVRRYRDGASPLVRDMVAGWRTGRFDAVLQGDFDLIAAA